MSKQNDEELAAKLISEKLGKALSEADEVVETMLKKPHQDQVKFRMACIQQMFKALVENELLTTELCVAMSYFTHATEILMGAHPEAVKDVQLSMDKKALAELKELYEKAKSDKAETFEFKGQEIDVGYAKYMIEYLESHEGLAYDNSDDDKIVPFDEDR